jgi:outer membrane protein insertion porin family
MFGSLNNSLNNGGNNFVASQRTYQVEASFIEPHLAGTNTSMAVTGFGRDLNSFMIEQAMQRTLGASVNFSRPLGHNLNADLGFTGEDVGLKDVSSLYASNNILGGMINRAIQTGQASGAGAYNLAKSVRGTQLTGGAFVSVSPTLRYDTRDAPIDPTKGTLIKLSTTPSLGVTGAGFAKFGLSASKYVKVNENTTLATNIQGGKAIGNVPQFAQYWMGGWNGVRGYRSFTDLGTGTSMLMATAELRTRLPFLHNSDNKFAKTLDKHLKGVVFFDAGQVSGNTLTNSLLSRGGLGASTGLGIRINVPMLGLIRVDYGMPLVTTLLGRMTPRVTIGFGDKF